MGAVTPAAVYTNSHFPPEATQGGGICDVDAGSKVIIRKALGREGEAKAMGGKRQRLSKNGVGEEEKEGPRGKKGASLDPGKRQLQGKGRSSVGGIDTAELFARVLREAGKEGGGGYDDEADDPEWEPDDEDLDAEGGDAGGGIGRLSKEQAEQVGWVGWIGVSLWPGFVPEYWHIKGVKEVPCCRDLRCKTENLDTLDSLYPLPVEC